MKEVERAELTLEACLLTVLPQEDQEQQNSSHGLCSITMSRYGASHVVRFMLVFEQSVL